LLLALFMRCDRAELSPGRRLQDPELDSYLKGLKMRDAQFASLSYNCVR